MLLVELDGVIEQVEDDAAEIERICERVRRVRDSRGDERRRSRAALEGAQVGVRSDGADRDRLLRAGRRRPAHAPARGAAPDRGALCAARSARRERVPRRRRQPPPTRPLRLGGGRDRAGARARGGDPRRLPRRRRLAHRRARRRDGQGVLDAADVLGARPAGVRAPAARVRSGRAVQPGQGDPDTAPLRRGAGAVPRSTRSRGSALPSVSSLEEASAALAAAHAERPAGEDRRRPHAQADSTGSSSTTPATSRARSRRAFG